MIYSRLGHGFYQCHLVYNETLLSKFLDKNISLTSQYGILYFYWL